LINCTLVGNPMGKASFRYLVKQLDIKSATFLQANFLKGFLSSTLGDPPALPWLYPTFKTEGQGPARMP
jgi:hypothetical protein